MESRQYKAYGSVSHMHGIMYVSKTTRTYGLYSLDI